MHKTGACLPKLGQADPRWQALVLAPGLPLEQLLAPERGCIPRQQIRAHRLGVQCLTDPDCRRAVTALVPTITGMGDHVSGRVRAICGQVQSGTRLTDLPYFSAYV